MSDTCDCCGCRMKYERIAETYTYICEDDQCRAWGYRELGKSFTALAVGPAQPVEEIPGCVWKHAATPFADNY